MSGVFAHGIGPLAPLTVRVLNYPHAFLGGNLRVVVGDQAKTVRVQSAGRNAHTLLVIIQPRDEIGIFWDSLENPDRDALPNWERKARPPP